VAELPGFDRKDVSVELENEVLTITATRKPADKEGEGREESFSRSITVDKSVLADKVTAKLENGLLRVTLPKTEERRPKLIKVS
jgi:HSP20 family protein